MKEIGSILATLKKSRKYPNLTINSEITKRTERALLEVYTKVGGERGELTTTRLAELAEAKMGEALCSGLSSDDEMAEDKALPHEAFVKIMTREIEFGERPMKAFLCSFGFRFGAMRMSAFLPVAKEEICRVLPHLIFASRPKVFRFFLGMYVCFSLLFLICFCYFLIVQIFQNLHFLQYF